MATLTLMSGGLPPEDAVVRGRLFKCVTAGGLALDTVTGWLLTAPPCLVTASWPSCGPLCVMESWLPSLVSVRRAEGSSVWSLSYTRLALGSVDTRVSAWMWRVWSVLKREPLCGNCAFAHQGASVSKPEDLKCSSCFTPSHMETRSAHDNNDDTKRMTKQVAAYVTRCNFETRVYCEGSTSGGSSEEVSSTVSLHSRLCVTLLSTIGSLRLRDFGRHLWLLLDRCRFCLVLK